MAMNRETKRMLQRQGQLGPDGAPARAKPQPRPAPRPVKERTSPRQYLREVRGELRKVAWPSRAEVTRYSVIVLITVVVLGAFIFLLDYAFAKSVFFLFD
ncbi:MAG: secE [Acidimicrobiales bacterium]|jgi:preprotein translocase subunit SecE|nr:secE [Acidimicrobiales bacterium]HZB70622.1 preprotein translocase subunit SecE [Acidimicrobiales bacterium]